MFNIGSWANILPSLLSLALPTDLPQHPKELTGVWAHWTWWHEPWVTLCYSLFTHSPQEQTPRLFSDISQGWRSSRTGSPGGSPDHHLESERLQVLQEVKILEMESTGSTPGSPLNSTPAAPQLQTCSSRPQVRVKRRANWKTWLHLHLLLQTKCSKMHA